MDVPKSMIARFGRSPFATIPRSSSVLGISFGAAASGDRRKGG
jgi:hypothetical protein